VPWVGKPEQSLQDEEWELYHVAEDFSLVNNVAADNPEKVEELKQLFEDEAIKNHVYPLDDRLYERFNAAMAGRPDLMGDRTTLTLGPGMTGMLENTFLNVKNRSKTIIATVDAESTDEGVILCQGGKFGGWALYMQDGKPAYTYNYFGLDSYTVMADNAVSGEDVEIKLEFAYDGDGTGKGGTAMIYVNGEKVAEGRIEKTIPAVFSADETADVGLDEATQVVSMFEDVDDSEFTGSIETVTISISD
jgi:hypothetical protein